VVRQAGRQGRQAGAGWQVWQAGRQVAGTQAAVQAGKGRLCSAVVRVQVCAGAVVAGAVAVAKKLGRNVCVAGGSAGRWCRQETQREGRQAGGRRWCRQWEAVRQCRWQAGGKPCSGRGGSAGRKEVRGRRQVWRAAGGAAPGGRGVVRRCAVQCRCGAGAVVVAVQVLSHTIQHILSHTLPILGYYCCHIILLFSVYTFLPFHWDATHVSVTYVLLVIIIAIY